MKKMKLQMKTQMKNKWKKVILNISNLWLDANHIRLAGSQDTSRCIFPKMQELRHGRHCSWPSVAWKRTMLSSRSTFQVQMKRIEADAVLYSLV